MYMFLDSTDEKFPSDAIKRSADALYGVNTLLLGLDEKSEIDERSRHGLATVFEAITRSLDAAHELLEKQHNAPRAAVAREAAARARLQAYRDAAAVIGRHDPALAARVCSYFGVEADGPRSSDEELRETRSDREPVSEGE